jgi:hypothetical protein
MKEEPMMKSRNTMIGTVALGAAAYLLRNKETRDKVMTQLQSLAKPENIEKIKNQFRSFSSQDKSVQKTDSSDKTYKEQTLQGTHGTDDHTTTKHQSLLGTDFAQKEEDDAHSLAEAPKLL